MDQCCSLEELLIQEEIDYRYIFALLSSSWLYLIRLEVISVVYFFSGRGTEEKKMWLTIQEGDYACQTDRSTVGNNDPEAQN